MRPPPVIGATPCSRAPLLVAVSVVVLAMAVLFLFDPARHAFYPKCLFHTTTGLYCPGCGGLRGLHELLHGHWLTALRMNFLAFGLAPLLILFGLCQWARQRGRSCGSRRARSQAWFFWLVGGAVVAFGVLRNLPLHPFTLLAP